MKITKKMSLLIRQTLDFILYNEIYFRYFTTTIYMEFELYYVLWRKSITLCSVDICSAIFCYIQSSFIIQRVSNCTCSMLKLNPLKHFRSTAATKYFEPETFIVLSIATDQIYRQSCKSIIHVTNSSRKMCLKQIIHDSRFVVVHRCIVR